MIASFVGSNSVPLVLRSYDLTGPQYHRHIFSPSMAFVAKNSPDVIWLSFKAALAVESARSFPKMP